MTWKADKETYNMKTWEMWRKAPRLPPAQIPEEFQKERIRRRAREKYWEITWIFQNWRYSPFSWNSFVFRSEILNSCLFIAENVKSPNSCLSPEPGQLNWVGKGVLALRHWPVREDCGWHRGWCPCFSASDWSPCARQFPVFPGFWAAALSRHPTVSSLLEGGESLLFAASSLELSWMPVWEPLQLQVFLNHGCRWNVYRPPVPVLSSASSGQGDAFCLSDCNTNCKNCLVERVWL